jgi:hypothetical protein
MNGYAHQIFRVALWAARRRVRVDKVFKWIPQYDARQFVYAHGEVRKRVFTRGFFLSFK